MLKNIKLITYNIHYGRLKIERDFPEKNAFEKSITELNWLLSYVYITLFFLLLLQLVDYKAIVDIWPYDFGREHGKNFIAPSAIFFIVIWYLSRRMLISEFLNEEAFHEMEKYYGSEGIERKEHNFLINIDTFLFLATSGCIAFQLWGPLALCLVAFIVQEVWIRRRFSLE
ncbi:hypothetical protein ACI2RL_002654 [Vibrio alginolyticus]|uniref:hypothetical protein n=1 Tax=Vibrio harveyi TaxID=669 RepID=UPI00280F90AB|nr:hypothetical protein [Vibrio harveyi]EGQ9764227.1 hypothetical protein [Vibrio alginolyticus]ELB2845171.1 hypothetical protein [Vibrio alginolyticus]ELU8568257.1 hypothetical protein [Vibrio alginolyticus]CAK6716298.1 conserved membrane hypothetical protein [Vibrio harveyi]